MTTSTTTAGTTMRAIIQENYGEAENVLQLGRWLGGSDRQLRAVMLSPFTGQHLGTLLCSENQADLLALTELIESGQVTPAIDKTYPLSETITAIRHMRDGHARGKVIISISDAKAIAETPREAKQLGPIGH